MQTKKKSRILYLLKYLSEKTDDTNPVSTNDIMQYLSSIGIDVHRDTVYNDIDMLLEYGVDEINDGGLTFQITDIMVHPDYQGKGVGKMIMDLLRVLRI